MTRHKAWIWVLLMALVLPAQADERAVGIEARVPEAIRAAEGFDPAESAGLFVGIRTFKDSRFAKVPFAVDDAVDLAHLFALDLALIEPQRVVGRLGGQAGESCLRQASPGVASGRGIQGRSLWSKYPTIKHKGYLPVATAPHGPCPLVLTLGFV